MPDDRSFLCPRCDRVRVAYPGHSGYRPAVSRVAPIAICSECGADEAARAAAGLPLIPSGTWPVTAPPLDWAEARTFSRTLTVRVTPEVADALADYATSLGVPTSVVHRHLLTVAVGSD